MGWIEKEVGRAFERYIRSDAFGALVKTRMIEIMRTMPDDRDLTYVGFINKMALAIYDASAQRIGWDNCKKQAVDIYRDFVTGEGIKFGDEEYDWTGLGAKTLAHEMSISYWDA